MATVEDYYDFFLGTGPDPIRLQLLEIAHPGFSATYRIVRNLSSGVTVTHESPPGGDFFYQYLPVSIEAPSSSDDLDQSARVTIGDLGEIIPLEIDNVIDTNTMLEKPVVTYREYASFDLSEPLFGPVQYEIETITMTEEGSTFEAKAVSVNVNKTGELYTVIRFPMLRGLL